MCPRSALFAWASIETVELSYQAGGDGKTKRAREFLIKANGPERKMKERKNWEPGVCPTPDTQPDLIYFSVGMALTWWERLDTALLMTFGVLIGSSHYAALRALGRVESPAARVQVLLEAFRSADPSVQSRFPGFEATIGQVDHLTGARNAIAHGQVTEIQMSGRPKGYYLTPGFAATRKVRRPSQEGLKKTLVAQTEAEAIQEIYTYALTAARITDFGQEFERLWRLVRSWKGIEYSFPISD